MGVWVAKPNLGGDERIRWQSPAGRSLNRWITSGGKLLVTNRRVLFQPNRFDMFTGKSLWDCPLTSAIGIAVVDRDPAVLSGGMRKRIEIQTSDGTQIFVMNQVDKKAQALRKLLNLTE